MICIICGYGEIGIHGGLKILWERSHAGSSPAIRTICLGRTMASTEPCQGSDTGSIPVQDSFGDMAEQADASDLESGSSECRFDSCYPHFFASDYVCMAPDGFLRWASTEYFVLFLLLFYQNGTKFQKIKKSFGKVRCINKNSLKK